MDIDKIAARDVTRTRKALLRIVYAAHGLQGIVEHGWEIDRAACRLAHVAVYGPPGVRDSLRDEQGRPTPEVRLRFSSLDRAMAASEQKILAYLR